MISKWLGITRNSAEYKHYLWHWNLSLSKNILMFDFIKGSMSHNKRKKLEAFYIKSVYCLLVTWALII